MGVLVGLTTLPMLSTNSGVRLTGFGAAPTPAAMAAGGSNGCTGAGSAALSCSLSTALPFSCTNCSTVASEASSWDWLTWNSGAASWVPSPWYDLSPEVVLISAGGAAFTVSLFQNLVAEGELSGSTLTLVDTNAEALNRMADLARLLFKESGANITVEQTTDRRAALDGAGFVVNTEAIDRNRLWRHDFAVPKKHSIRQTLGENGGHGGLFFTLRTMPLIFDFARAKPIHEDWFKHSWGECAVQIIGGILHNRHRFIEAGIVLNRGVVPNLPPDLAVEVPMMVDAAGPHPISLGPLPDAIAKLLLQQTSVQQIATEAAIHGSKELAMQTLLLNLVITSTDAAKAILDELWEINQPYIRPCV